MPKADEQHLLGLMQLVRSGTLSKEEFTQQAVELLEVPAQSPSDCGGGGEKRKRKAPSQVGRKQRDRERQVVPLLLDGMGCGTAEDWQRCVFVPLTVPAGAQEIPTTASGAGMWLAEKEHVGFPTVWKHSGPRTVVRRCVGCPPMTVDGVTRVCGVMVRMDKSYNWQPRIRVADGTWGGEHLASSTQGAVETPRARRRANSPFDVDREQCLVTELRKGRNAKKIYNDLVNMLHKESSREGKVAMVGKEAVEQALGFTLKQVQEFGGRFRRCAGNGFVVNSIAQLHVCDELMMH